MSFEGPASTDPFSAHEWNDQLRLARFRRFRLVSLMGMTTLCAVLLAFHVHNTRLAAQQRMLIGALSKEGAHTLCYEWEWDEYFVHREEPTLPAWAIDRFGQDYFYDINTFLLDEHNEPEALIERARGLGPLRMVRLGGCAITTQTAKVLVKLEHLEWLGFCGSQIDDDVLARLSTMKQLRILDIRGTKISDASIENLTKLNRLAYLYLGGSDISSDGILKLQSDLPACTITNSRSIESWPILSESR